MRYILRPANRLVTGNQVVGQYRDKTSSDRSSGLRFIYATEIETRSAGRCPAPRCRSGRMATGRGDTIKASSTSIPASDAVEMQPEENPIRGRIGRNCSVRRQIHYTPSIVAPTTGRFSDASFQVQVQNVDGSTDLNFACSSDRAYLVVDTLSYRLHVTAMPDLIRRINRCRNLCSIDPHLIAHDYFPKLHLDVFCYRQRSTFARHLSSQLIFAEDNS